LHVRILRLERCEIRRATTVCCLSLQDFKHQSGLSSCWQVSFCHIIWTVYRITLHGLHYHRHHHHRHHWQEQW